MSEAKRCRTCGVELVVGVNITESCVRHSDYVCSPCDSVRRNGEIKGISPNRGKRDKVCRCCGVSLVVGVNTTQARLAERIYICRGCQRVKYHDANLEHSKRYRARRRMEVIEKYGGVCECCEENRIEFLVIDHIHGGGIKERKLKPGQEFYRDLAKTPRRDDLRVLCHNCNAARGLYGYCPHEREREAKEAQDGVDERFLGA